MFNRLIRGWFYSEFFWIRVWLFFVGLVAGFGIVCSGLNFFLKILLLCTVVYWIWRQAKTNVLSKQWLGIEYFILDPERLILTPISQNLRGSKMIKILDPIFCAPWFCLLQFQTRPNQGVNQLLIVRVQVSESVYRSWCYALRHGTLLSLK